ncbi:MAG TPA: hypothetical protein IAB48_10740 [Candidatus Fimimorpha excrementavium]|nr:hypothetical protein [Candidatus Fimimorpha excrementavium]
MEVPTYLFLVTIKWYPKVCFRIGGEQILGFFILLFPPSLPKAHGAYIF